jgi:hypothetical protein
MNQATQNEKKINHVRGHDQVTRGRGGGGGGLDPWVRQNDI